jgi:membrane associated rhomboid family serine protease
MLLIVALVAVGVLVSRLMTETERERVIEGAFSILRLIVAVARRPRPELESFRGALRARSPIAVTTPVILLSGVAMFALIHFEDAPGGSPLLFWGGSFGPLTTNAEWWRLATSMLIHPTTWLLVVNAAALITVAPLLERYVGTIALIAVYVMSGLIAAAVNLWSRPVAVSGAASGPICGLYGLLLASVIWSLFHRWRQSRRPPGPEGGDAPEEPPTIFIPSSAIAWTLPAALAFAVSHIASDDLSAAAELAAFGAGFASGVLITRRAFQKKPAARQVGLVAAGAGAIVIAIAVPVRGIADVKPEIERVVALEARTAGAYRATYERYAHGKGTAEALAQQIDHTILPDLQAADERLKGLQRVPQEHQGLVADAEEYLRLRIDSWRLRAQALRKKGRIPDRDAGMTGVAADAAWRVRAEAEYRTNMAAFGRSEGAERASQEALQRIRPR